MEDMRKQFYDLGARAQGTGKALNLIAGVLRKKEARLPRKLKKKLRKACPWDFPIGWEQMDFFKEAIMNTEVSTFRIPYSVAESAMRNCIFMECSNETYQQQSEASLQRNTNVSVKVTSLVGVAETKCDSCGKVITGKTHPMYNE